MRKPSAMRSSNITAEPVVVFDADNKKFNISGSSEPSNTKEFFADLFIWLEIYSMSPLESQTLSIQLKDFNASSSFYLLKLFEMWLSIHSGNTIEWIYDCNDPELFDAGNEYKEMIGDRFNLQSSE